MASIKDLNVLTDFGCVVEGPVRFSPNPNPDQPEERKMASRRRYSSSICANLSDPFAVISADLS